eukprot:2317887-Heterocapsa_arctica.AAC.1
MLLVVGKRVVLVYYMVYPQPLSLKPLQRAAGPSARTVEPQVPLGELAAPPWRNLRSPLRRRSLTLP